MAKSLLAHKDYLLMLIHVTNFTIITTIIYIEVKGIIKHTVVGNFVHVHVHYNVVNIHNAYIL